MFHLIGWIFVGMIAGWLSGKIMKGGGFGVLGNLAIGIVGAVIGGFVFDAIGLQTTSTIGSIIMATVGAVILLFAIGKIDRRSLRR